VPSGEKKAPEGELPPGIRIYLEVLEGPDAGKKFELKKLSTVIGRKNCEVMLSDGTVSSQHCSIEVSRDDIMVSDKNSTNGTFVNNEQITSCPLQNLDEIKLGETRMLFSIANDPYAIYHDDAGAEEEALNRTPIMDEHTSVLGPGLYNPELPANFHSALEVTEGPNKGQRYQLKQRSTVVGRKGADINLDDEAASMRHFQLEIHSKDKITIKDLASRNGTRVNRMLVSAVKVRTGDELEIGKTKMTFYFRVSK